MIQSIPQTMNELEARVREIERNNNGMSWYLSFKPQCDGENGSCR